MSLGIRVTRLEPRTRGQKCAFMWEDHMPKYVNIFKYTPEGAKGFLKEKAAGREAALKKAIESAGGKLESLFWVATGEYSGIAIFESPDVATLAALGTLVMSTGVVSETRVMELLTTSELDHALGKSVTYRPPGG
jgi:uncharacterized protein with GYD domain